MFKWLTGGSDKKKGGGGSSAGGGNANNELGLSPEDLAALGLSPDEVNMGGGGGDGSNMTDADLLAEFSMSEGVPVESAPPKRRKPSNQRPDVDVDAVLAETDGDTEVQFTEDDMKDPALLGELAEFGWQSSGDEAEPEEVEETETYDVTTTHSTTIDHSAAILDLKRKAVAAKRAGRKDDALRCMRAYKALEAEQANSHRTTAPRAPTSGTGSTRAPVASVPPAAPVSQTSVPSPPVSSGSSSAYPPTSQPSPVPSHDVSPMGSVETIATVQSQIMVVTARIKEYQVSALNYKKNDMLPEARQSLKTAKKLQLHLENLKLGIPIDMTQVPGAPSPRPDAPSRQPSAGSRGTAGAQSRAAARQAGGGGGGGGDSHDDCTVEDSNNGTAGHRTLARDDGHVYDMLIGTVEDQIRTASAKSEKAYKTGDKPTALKLEAEKKGLMKDLLALRRSHSSGIPPPQYSFEEREVVDTKSFPDINEAALQVSVLKGMNFPGVPVETYVTVDFEYPKENPQQRESSRAKASQDPEYGFGAVIHIDRRSRALQKFFERRKISFSVWQPKFLRSPALIGKADVKLNPLLKQCEIDLVTELVDARRRKTGGLLEIRLRLRHPLMQEETTTSIEKRLIIGAYNVPTPPTSGTDKPAAAPATTDTASNPPASTTDTGESQPAETGETGTDATPAEPEQAEPEVPKPPPQTIKEAGEAVSDLTGGVQDTDEEIAMYIDDPLNVDLIVSNNVLEKESEELTLKLGQMAAKGRIPDDLNDRKTAIDLKMQLLVIEVQTGKLTMDGYLERVKKAMGIDKKLAVQLNKMGKKQEAYAVLQRVKVMKAEVSEAEGA